VEVPLGHTVQLGDPAVFDDHARLGIVRRAQRDQPKLRVLDREPVQVHPLPVHEADSAYWRSAFWLARSIYWLARGRGALRRRLPSSLVAALLARQSRQRRAPGFAHTALISTRRDPRAVAWALPGPSVVTTMRVRSARNRSRENSIGSPPSSVTVRVIASSGAPGSTSRIIASSGAARTTSMRSVALAGLTSKWSSMSS